MRWLLSFVVVLALATVGCTARQAQRATQTALTAAMEGVVAGDEAVVAALPGSGERARARAEERCMGTCPDLAALVLEELRPWDQAVTGLQHARSTLYVLQDALNVWMDTGSLPDVAPICGDVENVFGDLVDMLEAVDVDVPLALEQVVPHVSTACEAVAGYVQSRR